VINKTAIIADSDPVDYLNQIDVDLHEDVAFVTRYPSFMLDSSFLDSRAVLGNHKFDKYDVHLEFMQHEKYTIAVNADLLDAIVEFKEDFLTDSNLDDYDSGVEYTEDATIFRAEANEFELNLDLLNTDSRIFPDAKFAYESDLELKEIVNTQAITDGAEVVMSRIENGIEIIIETRAI